MLFCYISFPREYVMFQLRCQLDLNSDTRIFLETSSPKYFFLPSFWILLLLFLFFDLLRLLFIISFYSSFSPSCSFFSASASSSSPPPPPTFSCSSYSFSSASASSFLPIYFFLFLFCFGFSSISSSSFPSHSCCSPSASFSSPFSPSS